MKIPPDITVEWLLKRSIEEGDCLIWQGSARNNGRDPEARIDGDNFPVRRAVLQAMGSPLKPGFFVGTTCGTLKCVCPDHVIQRDRSLALKGHQKTPTGRANIAKAQRARSTRSDDMIREIRASELPATEAAEKFGYVKSSIWAIRNGRMRAELSSPFAGLGAR